MLSARNISFERHYERVFEPVSFSLSGGDLLVLTGDNGSGKTTLIRMLAGILKPSEGSLDGSGESSIYIGHQLAVKDDLTVKENIDFYRVFLGGETSSTHQAITELGLDRVRNQAARTLSAGQRKRCALSRLVLSSAPIWYLDEPHSNLDQDGIELLDSLLISHLSDGGACVMSSHGKRRPAYQPCNELNLVSSLDRNV